MQHVENGKRFGTRLPHIITAIVFACILLASIRPLSHALHQEFFLEPDSIGYISIGSNIFHGRGFTDFEGDWCSDWPPLFPLVIGFVEYFSRSPVVAVGIVATSCLTAALFVTFVWLKQLTKSIYIQAAAVLLLAFTQALTNLYNSALSETLFIPLTICCILSTESYISSGRRRYLALTILAALCCFLTRYTGVTVIAAVTLSLMTLSTTWRRKLLIVAIFLLSVGIPILTWCLINKHFTGTFMGDRGAGVWSVHDCIIALFGCLSDGLGGPWMFGLLLLAFGVGAVYMLFKQTWPRNVPARTALFFIFFFGFITVWSSSHFDIDMVDARLTSPLIIPVLCTCIGIFEPFRQSSALWTRRTWTAALVASCVSVIAISFPQPQVLTGGYMSPIWQNSNTLKYVKKTSFGSDLYSNDSAATYFVAHKIAQWTADESNEPTMHSVEEDINDVPEGAYVVWFYNALEPTDFNAKELAKACNLRIDAQFDDGVVYRRMDSSTLASATLQ